MKKTRPTDPTGREFIDLATQHFKESLTEAINATAVLFCFELESGIEGYPMAFVVMPCHPTVAQEVLNTLVQLNAPRRTGEKTNAAKN